SELRTARAELATWAPPEPDALVATAQFAPPSHWWQNVPVWAQTAAALLFLGVAAGVANLDIQYDQRGLSVHTGWLRSAPVPVPTPQSPFVPAPAATATAAPWRSDLSAVEQRLRADLDSRPAAARTADAEMLRRVRAIVDESA